MEITYTKVGDYLIPDLTLSPETDDRPIGVWGMRHKRYFMEHKKAIFTIMQMNGTLQTYLADLNEDAEDMFLRFVKQLAENEGVTEQLKADNQMLWVQKMNNIRNRATEIVKRNIYEYYRILLEYTLLGENAECTEMPVFFFGK